MLNNVARRQAHENTGSRKHFDVAQESVSLSLRVQHPESMPNRDGLECGETPNVLTMARQMTPGVVHFVSRLNVPMHVDASLFQDIRLGLCTGTVSWPICVGGGLQAPTDAVTKE